MKTTTVQKNKVVNVRIIEGDRTPMIAEVRECASPMSFPKVVDVRIINADRAPRVVTVHDYAKPISIPQFVTVGVVEADRTPKIATVLAEHNTSTVDLLLNEWYIDRDQHKLRKCLRRVLGGLAPETQLVLRRNPKLQVTVSNKAPFSVWAYFPMHRRRTILSHCEMGLAPGARVLLLINPNIVDSQSQRQTCDELRDHLGHVLLYLREPKDRNECSDATREFERSKRRR